MIAVVALIGDDVGRFVLRAFTDDQVQLTVDLFLILSATAFLGLAQSLPYAATVALGRYWLVAVATLVRLQCRSASRPLPGRWTMPTCWPLQFP